MGFSNVRFQPGFREINGSDLNTMIDQLNAGPSSGPTYYVNETIGSDNQNNNGQNPYSPLATLDRALVIEGAALSARGLSSVGRNAQVAFWGTQHRTSSLVWSLPQTHLIGLGATERRGKRARISVSGSTGFNKLVSVTGQGCQFANFGTFFGWADSSTSLLAWSDTAGRSCYSNVEFLGFGDDTVTTGSANLTGSRAFYFNSSNGETSWYDCVFGVDTKARNAANYTLELAGGAPRLHFENCTFEAQLGASGGASSHILIGASGIDRYAKFKGCEFFAGGSSGGTAMAQAVNVDASPGGDVLFDQSTFARGITAIQTTPVAAVQINMVAATSGGGKSHVTF